jgi:hypothetical protein
MAEPPLLAGALQETDAVVPPVAVAETLCGALGTTAVTVAVEFEFAEVPPRALVAVTTQRIVLPASAATRV